jgi:hypothetical protein
MTATTTVKVFGVKEALKELNKLDSERRKAVNARAVDIARPATDSIKAAYPVRYLSGMSRTWQRRGRALFPYDQATAQKGVKLKIDTSKKNTSTIRIQQLNPAAAIIDMAGKAGGQTPQGTRFVDALQAQFGPPSRVMWPAYERKAADVERQMFELIEQLMAELNKRLVM